MGAEHAILMLIGLLLLALLIQPLARTLHVPFSATLVLAGFAVSELLVMGGIDTGIRADNFHDLIFYVFLPVLIFESAYNIDARLLFRNLAPILLLAIPVMLLSTMITAGLVYAGIAHPAGFPWIAALLTGALLSATDPVAVVALFRQMGVSERLAVLVEGESLFNDATAIVVFGIFLAMATGNAGANSLTDATLQFLKVFLGGILAGIVAGIAFAIIMRVTGETVLKALASLISAYLAYLFAEALLHVSGVMAVLVTGLILGRETRKSGAAAGNFIQQLWEFNAFVANALVFLLMGVTITVDMFTERWLAILIGIAGVLIARAVGIFSVGPLLSRLAAGEPVTRPQQIVIFWGGLRGAVTLALALSLPTTLDYWWTIQSIAFGVVIFTLFVQATTIAPLLRHYRLDR